MANRFGTTPNTSPSEKLVKASLVIEIVAPLVISSPMPRSEVSVASVMMNGGRPILDDAEAVERADARRRPRA